MESDQERNPFDNNDYFSEVWRSCHAMIRKFKLLQSLDLGVTDSVQNTGKYSIVKADGAIVLDDLSEQEVASVLVLARYKAILETLKKKSFKEPFEFFNELESNREYHCRQLITLVSSNKEEVSEVLKPDVKRLTIGTLEDLDLLVYKLNRDSQLGTYEQVWLVNGLLVEFATWEVSTYGSDLFKEDYVTATVQNTSMPSHIRIMSTILEKKKERVLETYPQSMLMNYSYFYPIDLYHTGKKPVEN